MSNSAADPCTHALPARSPGSRDTGVQLTPGHPPRLLSSSPWGKSGFWQEKDAKREEDFYKGPLTKMRVRGRRNQQGGEGGGWSQSPQFSSTAQSHATVCDPTACSTPGLPVHHQLPELLKLTPIESVMTSNHLILCRTLLLLPSMFPSIRVFSNESALQIRWPKYWSFSFSPSNDYSGLISFRTDWLDLLAVQGTLKSLLQHHSSNASIVQC